MKLIGKALGLLIFLFPVNSSGVEILQDGPLWPLELSTRYLTSNFMEFRNGRFHAGLDLKTQSREGFVVRAVEDGFISRVRCASTAYGRVVYLRGVSGRTFVFAHLSRFNDDLRARILQVQEQSGHYRTSLEFKAGQIPIKRGEVLGLTGQSGTGGPHLHFEVRDRNQRPLNPLGQGFAVEDTFPPVIHTVRAWPVTPAARINGQTGEWVFVATEDQGLIGDLDTLQVHGPVAFSARMIDASDIRGHKLEPWLIELELDGTLVYRCQNDRCAFSENSLQRLEWTNWADPSEHPVPREHWLHRRAANTLHGRQGSLWYLGQEGSGLPVGDHQLVLKVSDFGGQVSSVAWVLQVQKEVTTATASSWQKQPLGFGKPGPEVFLLSPFFSLGSPEVAGYASFSLSPSHQDPVLEPVEIWVKEQGSETSFFDLARSQGLEPWGPASMILAVDWPIDGSVPLVLPGSGPAKKIKMQHPGVYRLSRQNRWEMVCQLPSVSVRDFLLEEPGLHGVFGDSVAPVFHSTKEPLQVASRGDSTNREAFDGITLSRWEITPIALVDTGSGVDTGTIKAELDGCRLIIEPDGPRDRLLVEWPDTMATGEHSLHIVASDRVGNTAQVTYKILVLEE